MLLMKEKKRKVRRYGRLRKVRKTLVFINLIIVISYGVRKRRKKATLNLKFSLLKFLGFYAIIKKLQSKNYEKLSAEGF